MSQSREYVNYILFSFVWLSMTHTSYQVHYCQPFVQRHHCKGCVQFLTSTMATHISSRSRGLAMWRDNRVIIILDRGEIIKYVRSQGEGGSFRVKGGWWGRRWGNRWSQLRGGEDDEEDEESQRGRWVMQEEERQKVKEGVKEGVKEICVKKKGEKD